MLSVKQRRSEELPREPSPVIVTFVRPRLVTSVGPDIYLGRFGLKFKKLLLLLGALMAGPAMFWAVLIVPVLIMPVPIWENELSVAAIHAFATAVGLIATLWLLRSADGGRPARFIGLTLTALFAFGLTFIEVLLCNACNVPLSSLSAVIIGILLASIVAVRSLPFSPPPT